MKKSLLSFLAGAAIFAVSLSSCSTGPCKDVNCGTNGTCVDGNCSCEPGYEGSACDIEFATKYISATGWSASDNTTASTAGTTLGVFTYVPTLTKGAANRVLVSGMSGFADSVIDLTLNASTTFTIADTDAAGRTFAGTGSITADGKTISANYTVTFSDGTSDTITATWTQN